MKKLSLGKDTLRILRSSELRAVKGQVWVCSTRAGGGCSYTQNHDSHTHCATTYGDCLDPVVGGD